MSTTGLRWALRTDVGMVRRANQDAGMANGSIFAVADGMGGHRGGEVASEIVSGHLQVVGEVGSVDELRDSIIAANDLIRARADIDIALLGMGTTLVAMAVLPTQEPAEQLQLAAVNVGDSRLYVLEGTQFTQLSVDHSLVSELVRAGQITPEEAARHPQRNVVTRALGAEKRVAVDTWLLAARVGQRYLMCSDGLVNEVSDESIGRVLVEVDDPDVVASQLVDMANESGGRDNITVLIVDVVEAPPCDPDETKS